MFIKFFKSTNSFSNSSDMSLFPSFFIFVLKDPILLLKIQYHLAFYNRYFYNQLQKTFLFLQNITILLIFYSLSIINLDGILEIYYM